MLSGFSFLNREKPSHLCDWSPWPERSLQKFSLLSNYLIKRACNAVSVLLSLASLPWARCLLHLLSGLLLAEFLSHKALWTSLAALKPSATVPEGLSNALLTPCYNLSSVFGNLFENVLICCGSGVSALILLIRSGYIYRVQFSGLSFDIASHLKLPAKSSDFYFYPVWANHKSNLVLSGNKIDIIRYVLLHSND